MAIYEGLAAIVGIVRDYDLAFAPGYRERVAKTEGILSPPEPQPTPLCACSCDRKSKLTFSQTFPRSRCRCATP